MFKRVFIYFLLVNFSLVFAEPIDIKMNVEQKKMWNEWDKKFDFSDKESKVWVVFIRKFGKEKIVVKFPKKPELSCFYKVKLPSFKVQVKEEKKLYSLTVEPNNEKDTERFFNLKKKEMEKIPYYQIQDMHQKDNSLDIYFVDFLHSNEKKETFFHQRILVTENNIYTLFSHVESEKKDQILYFIESFSIIA